VAYVDFAYMVNRFGAEEIEQLFAERYDPPVTAEDIRRSANADPSDPVQDEDAIAVVRPIVEGFIDDAHSIVLGYIETIYGDLLPLTEATIPRSLRIHEAAIARYFMFGDGAIDVVRDNYNDAKEWLDLVARKKIHIGLDTNDERVPQEDPTEVTLLSEYETTYGTTNRVMTEARLNRYIDPT
jgi:phage gp36-like protein